MRPSFLLIAVVVLAGAVASGFWFFNSRPKPVEVAPAAEEARQEPRPPERIEPAPVVAKEAAPAPVPVPPARPEVPAHTRQLVTALTQTDFSKGPITAEQAALWKTNLSQLVQQGAAAVPAIREFLEQNKDIPYDYKQGGDLLGAHSLRLALLQALETIGGPESIELAATTLQTASQPREIAQLAHHLETQAQGQYRDAILHATRESLGMATVGKLGQTDTGPLFNVLAQYGGAESVPDLQKASSPFRYYAAISLAQLPEGAGIPALSEMLRQPNGPARGTHNPALEALAQLAPQHPIAAERILEQTRLKQIPETLWPSIAASLSGGKFFIGNLTEEGLSPTSGDKTYHLSQGPQNFFSRPNSVQFTPEQTQQTVQFIDQLLATELPPLGQESLLKAKANLTALKN